MRFVSSTELDQFIFLSQWSALTLCFDSGVVKEWEKGVVFEGCHLSSLQFLTDKFLLCHFKLDFSYENPFAENIVDSN